MSTICQDNPLTWHYMQVCSWFALFAIKYHQKATRRPRPFLLPLMSCFPVPLIPSWRPGPAAEALMDSWGWGQGWVPHWWPGCHLPLSPWAVSCASCPCSWCLSPRDRPQGAPRALQPAKIGTSFLILAQHVFPLKSGYWFLQFYF